MTVGFLMLCHTALERAAQVARFWAESGAPVVIHVDSRAPRHEVEALHRRVSDLDTISFSARHACEWGTWSLVAATIDAAQQMLDRHPEVRHVFLASGACLPLRPLAELEAYLAVHPDTDFIESVTVADVGWTVGGIDTERFTLRFPFSWRRNRRLFDGYVRLQRRFGFRRSPPAGLVPHLGSQWWCLTRRTLDDILSDPRRKEYDRYFKRVWIPDESYFQSLTRLHARCVDSRSLTLVKFDVRGKPHIFYDDHLELLRRSNCFVARKIWPRADRLYDTFLSPRPAIGTAEPDTATIGRLFDHAAERRTRGRPGLYMQSRFPRQDHENGKTAAPYSVFQGFTELFPEFCGWLSRQAVGRVHGHLFSPERVEFAGGASVGPGCLTDSLPLRDYNPRAFLTNLIWNDRSARQCFMLSPRDTQPLNWFLATDPNAQISVVTGAWAVRLFQARRPFAQIRREAARLQRLETQQLGVLRSGYVKARVRIWTLSEFVGNPTEPLQTILEEVGVRNPRQLLTPPQMVDLTGFGGFLQELRNRGMQPRLMGDFPVLGGWRSPGAVVSGEGEGS